MAKRTNKGPVVKVRQGDDISMVIVPIALSLGRYGSSTATNYALRLLVSKLQGVMQHHLAAQAQSKPLNDGQIVMAFEEEGFEVAAKTTQFVNKGEFLYTVSLKDLGIDRQHYAEFFDAIVRAGEYRIEYEGEDPELGHGLTWYNLYRPILWNYKTEEVTDKKGNVSTRYVSTCGPKVTIAIEPRAAQTIYNPAHHGKSIDTTGVKLHAYTERILYLFAPYWQRYTHIEIDWIALRLKMQLDEDVTPRSMKKLEIVREVREDEATGRKRGVYITTAPNTIVRQTEKETDGPKKGKPKAGGYRRTYESWSEFKREVLDPTISDFNGMAAVGRVPFTFTADVVKRSIPGKSNRPTPVRVIFDLTLTDAGQQSIRKSNDSLERIEMKKYIMRRTGIRESFAAKLANAERVGPSTYAELRHKVDELVERATQRKFTNFTPLKELIAAEKERKSTIPGTDQEREAIAHIEKAKKQYTRALPKYFFTCLQNFIKDELGFASAEDVSDIPQQRTPSHNSNTNRTSSASIKPESLSATTESVSLETDTQTVSSPTSRSTAPEPNRQSTTPDPNRQSTTTEPEWQAPGLTPAQAKEIANGIFNNADPALRYDFEDNRTTPTDKERLMLQQFTGELQREYAVTAPSFIQNILLNLVILRVNDERHCVTFALSDGSHITMERINYYCDGLYAKFYAIFNKCFKGYRFNFD